MSLNQTIGHTRFHQSERKIDFTINKAFSNADLIGTTSKSAGELSVGNQVLNLSYSEIQSIIDTLVSVKDTLYKQHKLGLLPR